MAHSEGVELERVVRILRGYGHSESEAVDIGRRILAELARDVVDLTDAPFPRALTAA